MMIGTETVAKESLHKHPSRRKLSNGHVIAPLLEAPLPMPRRSCYGSAAADAPVPRRFSAADASPQRRHVPFSWETAPGVPKITMGGNIRDVSPPLPRPPPGMCGGGAAPWCRASSCHEHTTTDGSSEDGGGDTFSDALDRASSSDRLALAGLSARLSSVDGRAVAASSSFIMNRFLPAANVIAATSADKPRPRRSPSPRRSVRRDEDDEEEEEAAAAAVARARQVMMNAPQSRGLAREQPKQQQSPPRQSTDAAAAQVPPRVNEEDQCDDEASSYARKCGLMLFLPWRAKPLLLSFPLSWFPRSSRASNASVASAAAPSLSPPRRSVTLGDVLEKERRLRDGGDLSRRWYEEKNGRSGKEWSGIGWGAGIVGTSKRYCADAKRALGRLARSATGGGGSPRLCKERRSGKLQAASVVRSESEVIPPLSPPSESWLSHARRRNAASSRR